MGANLPNFTNTFVLYFASKEDIRDIFGIRQYS
jgi:hypothetical protein